MSHDSQEPLCNARWLPGGGSKSRSGVPVGQDMTDDKDKGPPRRSPAKKEAGKQVALAVSLSRVRHSTHFTLRPLVACGDRGPHWRS